MLFCQCLLKSWRQCSRRTWVYLEQARRRYKLRTRDSGFPLCSIAHADEDVDVYVDVGDNIDVDVYVAVVMLVAMWCWWRRCWRQDDLRADLERLRMVEKTVEKTAADISGQQVVYDFICCIIMLHPFLSKIRRKHINCPQFYYSAQRSW